MCFLNLEMSQFLGTGSITVKFLGIVLHENHTICDELHELAFTDADFHCHVTIKLVYKLSQISSTPYPVILRCS